MRWIALLLVAAAVGGAPPAVWKRPSWPGSGRSRAHTVRPVGTATTRQRVAIVFDQTVIQDEAAAREVLGFAERTSAALQSYGKVLEDADRRIARVVTWMRQQIQICLQSMGSIRRVVSIGARYAATNPGRGFEPHRLH